MGVSDSSWFGLPLPFELSGYGLPGCFQLNSADVSFLLLASGTNMSFGFLTPASMSYYGFDLFLQCGVIDPAANALGLAVSNGAALDVRF
jgi:hypothetical protein